MESMQGVLKVTGADGCQVDVEEAVMAVFEGTLSPEGVAVAIEPVAAAAQECCAE